jgi:hypothetical protein
MALLGNKKIADNSKQSLDNLVTLSEESNATFKIEDYVDEFQELITDSSTIEQKFGNVYNQDKAVSDFFKALRSKYRAILNLGPCGVGKTTLTKELVNVLNNLSSDKKYLGPFEKSINNFFEKISTHQHQDIISLWNPKNYQSPIIVKSDPKIELFDNLSATIISGYFDLQEGLNREINKVILREYIENSITTTLYKSLDVESSEIEIFFDKNKNPKIKIINSDENSETKKSESIINKRLKDHYHDSFECAYEPNVDIVDSIWKETVSVLINNKKYKKRKNDENATKDHKNKLTEIIKDKIKSFTSSKSYWEENEQIYSWFEDVESYFLKERNLKKIVDGIISFETTNGIEIKQKLDSNNKKDVYTVKFYEPRLNFRKNNIGLEELLNPELLYEASDDSGLIITELSLFDYEDFFGYVDKDNGFSDALHSSIKLGALAYSDIIVVDDRFLPLVKEENFRRSLLSFLQNGELSIINENVQVSFKNDCYLIVNDTQLPFFKQDFEGMMPDLDEALMRRFNIVSWDSYVENTKENRQNFYPILNNSIKAYKKRNKISENIKLDAEAYDTIIQYILSEDSLGESLTTQIGDLEKDILEPAIIEALDNGREIVQAKDVINYIESLRDDKYQNMINSFDKLEYPYDFSEAIGRTNGLVVYSGTEVGGPHPINAIIGRKKGDLQSNDIMAHLSGKSTHKGTLNAEAWLESTFGPSKAKLILSYNGFEEGDGPSASAAQTYALMSAISNVPLKQNVFITGTLLDKEGNVGPIGGVYSKIRGSYKFFEKYNKNEDLHYVAMVPQTNISEFLRKVKFDSYLQDAMNSGKLELRYHKNIWDGFQILSGLERKTYEPMVKKGLKKINWKTKF